MEPEKIIISCAVTGSIHTPSMSPYLPVGPHEIATSAIEAARAGAAIVHLHVRRPEDGFPIQDVALFEEVVAEIEAETDVIINLTTGGSVLMTLEERLAPALRLKPELASLNMGSISINLRPMLRRGTDFQHTWEHDYLENSAGKVFKNTFSDIETILTRCSANGTRFEYECYDVGHLYNLGYFAEAGLAKPPFLVQGVFGLLGGIGAHPEDVMHMKRTADRLFGSDLVWSVLAAGKNQTPITMFSALLGGHIRVGLEDSLWERRGALATSNALQVANASSRLASLDLGVATPREARAMLALKGRSAEPAEVSNAL